LIQQVAVGDATQCSGRGGSKFITGSSVTYACNGTAGSSGSGGTLGQGTLDIGSCDGDNLVNFEIFTSYTGSDFVLDGVRTSGIDGSCIDSKLVLYFTIKDSGTIFLPNPDYSLGDQVICELLLTESGGNFRSSSSNSFLIPGATSCSRKSSAGVPRPAILMSLVGTRDLVGLIGFEIRG
jgi:hypothetical protein